MLFVFYFPISLPLLKPPYSLTHSMSEIRAIKNPTMATKYSNKRVSVSPTLNQKLGMAKLSEEIMLKAEIG